MKAYIFAGSQTKHCKNFQIKNENFSKGKILFSKTFLKSLFCIFKSILSIYGRKSSPIDTFKVYNVCVRVWWSTYYALKKCTKEGIPVA